MADITFRGAPEGSQFEITNDNLGAAVTSLAIRFGGGAAFYNGSSLGSAFGSLRVDVNGVVVLQASLPQLNGAVARSQDDQNPILIAEYPGLSGPGYAIVIVVSPVSHRGVEFDQLEIEALIIEETVHNLPEIDDLADQYIREWASNNLTFVTHRASARKLIEDALVDVVSYDIFSSYVSGFTPSSLITATDPDELENSLRLLNSLLPPRERLPETLLTRPC